VHKRNEVALKVVVLLTPVLQVHARPCIHTHAQAENTFGPAFGSHQVLHSPGT
jgi:hypothetical protein